MSHFSNNDSRPSLKINALRGKNLPIIRDNQTWTPNSRRVPRHRGELPADPDFASIERLYFWRTMYELLPDHDGPKVSGNAVGQE